MRPQRGLTTTLGLYALFEDAFFVFNAIYLFLAYGCFLRQKSLLAVVLKTIETIGTIHFLHFEPLLVRRGHRSRASVAEGGEYL